MGPKQRVTHSFFPTSLNLEYTQCRLIISAQSPGVVSREGSRFWCHLKKITAPFFFYRRVLFRKYGRCQQPGCNCRRRGYVFVRLACSLCFGDSLPRPAPRIVLAQQVYENSRLTPSHPLAGDTPTSFPARSCC